MADAVEPVADRAEKRVRIPLGVYLDTSSLIGINRNLQDPSLSALLAIRSRLNFELVVPQLVIDEYVAHHVRGDRTKIEKANDTLRFLVDLHGLDLVKLDVGTEQLNACIAGRIQGRLTELEAVIAPTPEIPLSTLVKESVSWTPPFAADDRGFRDAIIHEAMIAHARERWPDPLIIVVTDDAGWKDAMPRFKSRGVDVEFVSLKDAPKRIESFLDAAGRRWLADERRRALEFARNHQDVVFQAALETECDMWTLRSALGGGDDPLANRTIHRILSATPKKIASAFPRLSDDERELASDREAFDVFVDVEFEVETSFWTGGGSLFGPSFRIDRPVDIAKLPTQEPMHEQWEIVRVTRSVAVRGSVDRAAYEAGRFEDFRIEAGAR